MVQYAYQTADRYVYAQLPGPSQEAVVITVVQAARMLLGARDRARAGDPVSLQLVDDARCTLIDAIAHDDGTHDDAFAYALAELLPSRMIGAVLTLVLARICRAQGDGPAWIIAADALLSMLD